MIKRFLLFVIIIFILLLAISLPVLAAGEDDFWRSIADGDYNKAGEIAEEIGNTSPEYYSLAAICYLIQSNYSEYRIYKDRFERYGNQEKLLELSQSWETVNEEEPRALLIEGITLTLFTGVKPDEVQRILKKAEPSLSNDPYFLNYFALTYINKQNYSLLVQKYLERAIKLKKDFPEAYINLAAVLTENQQNDKAITILLNCFKNCPEVPVEAYESLIKLTTTPVNLTVRPFGEPISVIAPVLTEVNFNKIREILLITPQKTLGLAEVFIKKGSVDSAKQLIDGTNPVGWESLILYLKLQIAHLEGDDKKVIAAGDLLSAGNNLDYFHLYEVGNIFFYNKEFKMAEQFYERALTRANPEDYEYLTEINANLGACFYFMKDYTFARICFEKALNYNREDTFSLANLGLVYRDLGENDKAINYITKALEYIYDPGWRRELERILSELQN